MTRAGPVVDVPSRFSRPAALILLLVLFPVLPGADAGGGAVRLPAPAPGILDRIDPGVRVPPPRIRVALTRVPRPVEIGTTGGGAPRILDGQTGRPIVPEGFARGPVRVVAAGGNASPGGAVYRVQVGSFRSADSARELAEGIEKGTGEPAAIRWDAARMVWRVLVGEARSPGPLGTLLRELRLRWPDAWITGDRQPVLRGARLGLVGPRWRVFDPSAARLVFVPPDGEHLTAGGRPYRGLLEAFLSPAGKVVLVNELNLEDYLRGVVPEELGPAAWPELAALKAQAVAARTYALGNRGQYAAEGYDLCDTPRCQVYGGMGSEHPLSDRAVEETRGEFLAFGDRPINALYTSTCGGHTEDAAVVFPEMDAPWLRGVPCIPDEEALLAGSREIAGRPVPGEGAFPAPRDAPDPLDLGLLVAHGVVGPRVLAAKTRAGGVESAEIARWFAALAGRAGLPAPPPFLGAPTRLATWRHARLVFAGGGTDAALGPGDERALLTPAQLAELPGEDRRLVAGLVARHLLRPGPDGLFLPGGTPSRAEVLALLAREARRLDAIPVHRGTVGRGNTAGELVLRDRRTERSFSTGPPPPLLYARTGGRWHPVSRLVLWPGDRVLWVPRGDGGGLALLALRGRQALADDRFSRHYRWTVTRTREQIEESLSGVAPVGRLLDIRVLRRGISGRVGAIELVGTAGRAVVNGFRLRRALGLRETLFSLVVQHDPDGLVRRVVFDGRGWGHGVGMCQVGAYGMAARGADYRAILRHYYTGVRIVRFRPGEGR